MGNFAKKLPHLRELNKKQATGHRSQEMGPTSMTERARTSMMKNQRLVTLTRTRVTSGVNQALMRAARREPFSRLIQWAQTKVSWWRRRKIKNLMMTSEALLVFKASDTLQPGMLETRLDSLMTSTYMRLCCGTRRTSPRMEIRRTIMIPPLQSRSTSIHQFQCSSCLCRTSPRLPQNIKVCVESGFSHRNCYSPEHDSRQVSSFVALSSSLQTV